jgi:hypothetical protein
MARKRGAGADPELDRSPKLGHGEDSKARPFQKGEFWQVGTVAELNDTPISPNQKTRTPSGTGTLSEP